jgi:hypothetical protein
VIAEKAAREKRLAAVREREAERRREADRQTRESREEKTEQAAADDGDGEDGGPLGRWMLAWGLI